jgi:DNA-binding transcriptional LysR family regulator
MIDLRHLRHALALAEHGNFARAADACHITQPALTRSIQSLEAALGVTLFDRRRGGVEPTAFGRLVLDHAAGLDMGSRELERELQLAAVWRSASWWLAWAPMAARRWSARWWRA